MEDHSRTRYGNITQAFHWVTAILVLVAFIYGPGGSEQRVYSPARDFDRGLHETLGLCVFALVALRVLWRMVDKRPEPPQVSRWMGIAATVMQGALYLLLFAVPLTAIAGAWLEGHPLTLLAGVKIPLSSAFHMIWAKPSRTSTPGLAMRSCGSRDSTRSPVSTITLSSRTVCLPQCFRAGSPCDSRTGVEKPGLDVEAAQFSRQAPTALPLFKVWFVVWWSDHRQTVGVTQEPFVTSANGSFHPKRTFKCARPCRNNPSARAGRPTAA